MTLIAALLALCAFLYVVRPLMGGIEAVDAHEPEKESVAPILEQIEDLDLERAAGKIPADVALRVREELVGEAARVMKGAEPEK